MPRPERVDRRPVVFEFSSLWASRLNALAEALRAYIDAADITEDRKGFPFRKSRAQCKRAYRAADGAGRCVADDPPSRCRSRHLRADRQSHVSGHRHYCLFVERRCAGARTGNGRARVTSHHKALRPHEGATDSGRSRANQIVNCRGYIANDDRREQIQSPDALLALCDEWSL